MKRTAPNQHRAAPTGQLRLRSRILGAILWPSFFAAGVATTVFFAIVDPLDLATITWPAFEISREVGYTIGFFMFWLCTASACMFTALLLHPLHRVDGAHTA